MEKYKKNAGFYIIRIIGFLFFGCIGLALIADGYKESEFYKRNREEIVEVVAVISDIRETTDSDGDTEYDISIDYMYNGVEYEHIYYDTDKRTTQKEVGDKVSVEIFKVEPGELVEGYQLGMSYTVLFGLGAIFIAIMVLFSSSKKQIGWYVENYGLNNESIKEELLPIILRERKHAFYSIFFGIMVICAGFYFRFTPGCIVAVVLAVMFLFGGGGKLYKDFRRRKKFVDTYHFERQMEMVVKKWEESDGDGGTDYCVSFEQGTYKWKVSARAWKSIQINDIYTLVYIEGERVPTLLIDPSGNVYRC